MDFDAYQKLALRTLNTDLSHRERVSMSALGLAGEAGEVADEIKKVLYHGHEFDREELEKEIGDVLWYCAVLAEQYELKLSAIAAQNIAKLQARYPEGFSVEASRNRNDDA